MLWMVPLGNGIPARVDAVRGMEKERKQAGYDQHGWQSDTKVVALFALPTFAAFIIGFVIPFIMGVYLSFCKFTTVTDAEFVGLKNYKRLLPIRSSCTRWASRRH